MRVFLSTLLLTLALVLFSTNAGAGTTTETTCSVNALGDQTCVTTTTTTTTTSGTTTGNILDNSNFKHTGNNGYGTSGWTIVGDVGHGHNSTYSSAAQSGQDVTGGTLAFEGDPSDRIYQDQDLVGDGHLTKAQINEGFTSTMSADVWFWNSLDNDFTLKQTITASDGTVTTQIRVIEDTGCSGTNCGQFNNYTDSYTQSANTQNDYTIRAEMFNDTQGSGYNNSHRGPDVDNVQLTVTTAGATSSSQSSTSVTTLCADRDPPACTYDNEAVDEATEEITGDDGQSIDQSIETIVENDIINVDPVTEEVYVVQTVVEVENDLGTTEEFTVQEFVEESFTTFIEENGLEDEFSDALAEEGITEEEFFEELATEMENEFAESGMESFTEESTGVETETVVEEEPTVEEETVNTTEETVETESEPTTETTTEAETTESETNTETSTESEQTETETESTESETESSETEETENTEQEESTGNEEESVEEGNEEASTDEQDGTDASADGTDVDSEVSDISKKVEKIIAKITSKLKTIDQKLKVISIVTAQAMIQEQPNMSEYTQKQFYDTRQLADNPDWYAEDTILNAYGRSIYQDKTLSAYQTNDPVFQHQEEVNRVNENISRLEAELEVLRNERN